MSERNEVCRVLKEVTVQDASPERIYSSFLVGCGGLYLNWLFTKLLPESGLRTRSLLPRVRTFYTCNNNFVLSTLSCFWKSLLLVAMEMI